MGKGTKGGEGDRRRRKGFKRREWKARMETRLLSMGRGREKGRRMEKNKN